MPMFSGMPGVKKPLEGPLVGSVSAMVRGLSKHRIVSSAGDDGSVTAYVDDKGVLRATFCRYRSMIDGGTFKSKAELRRWLIEWMPKRYEFH